MSAPLTLRGHNPDVLTCIANLSNDEVFTPPEFANQMLDALARTWADANDGADIWADPEVTFLDPFTKSGIFLREIVRRLTEGLSAAIPELPERVDHILTKQVYGIGITQLTALLARRSVYCSKLADGEHSIATSFDSENGNIWFERTEHSWKDGKCIHCGASQEGYERDAALETHAYAFIHADDIRSRLTEVFGGEMRFDVIIGNPPYQLNDGGFGASAAPIYHRFVQQAMALDPRSLALVIPARWYSGGKGLSDFRDDMLRDRRIRELHDFPATGEVFPGVNNRGGVCYFLWDSEFDGEATICTYESGAVISSARRPLKEPGLDTFIRYNEGLAILKKVVRFEQDDDLAEGVSLPTARRFSEIVSSRKPFGLDTTFTGRKTRKGGDLLVFRNGGKCFAAPDDVPTGRDLIEVTKILIPYASPGSDDYPHLVLSKPLVAGPGEIGTETYLVVGPFDDESAAKNAASYMGTQFFRFMLTLMRASQHVTRSIYSLVPLQDFSRRWTDDDLAKKYSLTEGDREFIDRFVKPVAWAEDYE